MKVFKLKPSPHTVTPSVKDEGGEGGEVESQRSTATQVYNLHRGGHRLLLRVSFGQRTDNMLGWAQRIEPFTSMLLIHMAGTQILEAIWRDGYEASNLWYVIFPPCFTPFIWSFLGFFDDYSDTRCEIMRLQGRQLLPSRSFQMRNLELHSTFFHLRRRIVEP
jgi:hypothetical protein